MEQILIGIFSFLGGLLACTIITKINRQENSFFNIFGSNNKVNQSNENDKQNS
ncbi:hypothetical protein [Aliarcobacter skirrowii]|uniref:hypothetical protein n=1 Tax=Aliarcobacter skirrowii TaxID=28200 RepID=UPI0014034CA3|nr:hypothetical protein [Aliarcobacter skirrowii]